MVTLVGVGVTVRRRGEPGELPKLCQSWWRSIVGMVQATLQVRLYAVVAGLSPLAFAATIAVMQAGRSKALAFGIGFVVAQLLTCSLLVAIDVAARGSSRKHHPGIQVALEVAVAVALIWLAARVRRRPPTMDEASSARSRRLLARLGRLHLLTALGAGSRWVWLPRSGLCSQRLRRRRSAPPAFATRVRQRSWRCTSRLRLRSCGGR